MVIPIFSTCLDWLDPYVRVVAIMQVTSIFPLQLQQLFSCSVEIPINGTITYPIQHVFALNHNGIQGSNNSAFTNALFVDIKVVPASQVNASNPFFQDI